jgi:hypothetical protein
MKKKVLQSQETEDWRGYPLITLPVDEIWQSVPSVEKLRGMPFKDSLKKDILENGMRYPIMVVEVSYSDLLEAKRRYRKKICELPSDKFWGTDDPSDTKIWSVWGGSQRLTFAREEGFTHIHCTVIPTIAESISLQKHMRRGFPELYGKNKRR